MRSFKTLLLLSGALALDGCATYWQVQDLEEKVDRLVQNTNRATLSQIFGDQASAITQKMDTLSGDEQQKLDTLIQSYEKGSTTLDEVRSNMLAVLGGADRVVSNPRGVWARNEEGKKLLTMGSSAKIRKCQLLEDAALPETISSNKGLTQFRWGKGEYNGKTVLFPWELTMSAFAQEIVENSARRTAQEILKMAGDKGWNRPVTIQVVTEPGQSLKIKHPGAEGEVFVTGEQPAAETPPAAEQK